MIPFALNLHETNPEVVVALLLLLDNRGYLCTREQEPQDHLLMVNFSRPKTYSYCDTRYIDPHHMVKLPKELDEVFDRLNQGHTFLLTHAK